MPLVILKVFVNSDISVWYKCGFICHCKALQFNQVLIWVYGIIFQVDDRNEFMRQFLLYGHVLTTEEIEQHAEDGVPEHPPTLKQFQEQVMTSP